MNRQGITTPAHNLWLKSKYISGLGGGVGISDYAAAAIDKSTLQNLLVGDVDIINYQTVFFERNVNINLPAGQLIITKAGIYTIIVHIQIGTQLLAIDAASVNLKINGVISRSAVKTPIYGLTTLALTSIENLEIGDVVSVSVSHYGSGPYATRSVQIDMLQIQKPV